MKLLSLALLALTGCGGDTLTVAEQGARLFADAKIAKTEFNHFACTTCHTMSVTPSPQERYLAGGTLHDVVGRQSWWGGKETTLLSAVNICMVFFMHAAPLSEGDDDGRALYAYLAASSPSPTSEPATYTIPRAITTAPTGGDAGRGGEIYKLACQSCHGAAHTGAGRLDPKAFTLPEVTDGYAEVFPGIQPAVVVTEKVRHGQFFGVGGNMPFFSIEVLPDADLADVLAFLGLM